MSATHYVAPIYKHLLSSLISLHCTRMQVPNLDEAVAIMSRPIVPKVPSDQPQIARPQSKQQADRSKLRSREGVRQGAGLLPSLLPPKTLPPMQENKLFEPRDT